MGYIEREGRALHATEKGVQVIRLLGEHELTSAELTGQWERRLELIAQGEESRPSFMNDIASFTKRTVEQLDALKGVKIERANLGPCPVCGKDVNGEPQGLFVLVEGRPRLRVRDLEEEGGQEPSRVGRARS